ncbi:MAG: general secretion pathway protein GspB [Sterolibacterium sp.]|nr:general secretion pathway protein GspB [Sterolibacterium sp.]
MSFILDALRKSDQQRQRSVTPTLMTAQTPVTETRQPALWWYGVLAAVLVGAGILIGWLHQWQSEPAVPAIQSNLGRPLQASAEKFSPAALPALPISPRKPETQQPPRESTVVAQAAPPSSGGDTHRDAPAKPAMANQQPAVTSPKEAPAPVKDEHARPAPVDTAREPGAMPLTELPPALQQEIPKLSILAHSYSSKPKSRFVFINDQMWHEEEYPVPGLKLEQITPNGMIFSYKGYRFRRNANP